LLEKRSAPVSHCSVFANERFYRKEQIYLHQFGSKPQKWRNQTPPLALGRRTRFKLTEEKNTARKKVPKKRSDEKTLPLPFLALKYRYQLPPGGEEDF
jgi:hypothetical protein